MIVTPVEPTVPQTVSLSSVSELLQQAKRLGLMWDLRAATVAETTGAYSAYVPRIDLDGDEEDSAGITAVSFVDGLAVGMRIMVMFVPPVGSYVIGTFNPEQTQRYSRGAFTSHGTVISTTETVLETFTGFTLLPNAAYTWEVDGSLIGGAGNFIRFSLRDTNAAGQILDYSNFKQTAGLVPTAMRHVGYFRNVTSEPILMDIVLTGLTLGSTATWYAEANMPRYVSIRYAGPAVEYPSAKSIT